MSSISSVFGQVTLSSTTTGFLNNSNVANISHNSSGTNRLMIVGVSAQQPGQFVTSMTYNGDALTKWGSISNGSQSRVEIWYLVNPSNGTFNLVVNNSANDNAVISVQNYSWVNQTNPLGTIATATGNGTAATVNISSAAGELVYSVVGFNNGDTDLTPTASQAEAWDGTINGSIAGAGGTKAGATTVTMSWTSTSSPWSILGVGIKPSTPSPGGVAGLKTWFMADAGVSTSGSVVTTWTNQNTANSAIPTLTGTSGNTYNSGNSISYLPSISFSGATPPSLSSVMSTPTDYVSSTAGTLYGVIIDSTNSFTNNYAFGYGTNLGVTPGTEISMLRNGSVLDFTTGNGIGNVSLSNGGTFSAEASLISSKFSNGGIADDYAYFNGKAGTVANAPTDAITGGRLFAGGIANGYGQQGFDGVIGEIISFNTANTNYERNKVVSYLAAKWGITLDQTTATDYIDSDGAVYWDATANSTYKNRITVIGRDDNSGLNKKQSRSVHSGLKINVGLGTIASTNTANSNTFSVDKSFLAYGDDNASIAAWTSTGAPTGYKIITRKWKVAETGTIGSVKIQVADNSVSALPAELSNVYLITDADGNFSSGATSVLMTLNTTNWEANVDLTNGQFFTFATEDVAPGGVAGAAIWLKADAGTSTSTEGVTVNSWTDMSGNSNTVSQATGSKQPLFRNNTTDNINFNPVVDLDGTDDEMTDATGILGTSIYTNASVFAVTRTDAVKDHTLIDETVLAGTHFLLHNPWMDNNIHWDGANSNRISAAWSYTLGAPYLFTGHNNNSLTNKRELRVNGSIVNSSTAALNTFQGNNRPLTLGNEASSSKYYNGKIGEVMFYLTGLTVLERSQIESYLAIKYGFTLDQTTAQNYIASDGSTVYWNGTTNSSYKDNIAGIARDDASGLTQKQSKSVNTGLQVVVGNGNTIAASNAANSSTFSVDKSALVWGDNAGSASTWTSTGAPSSRQIIARSWKVQETGTIGSVKIQVADNSGANGLPAEATAVYLLVDADGNFSAGATEVAMTLNGTNWEGDVDLTNGQFFTFATLVPTAPGGVYSNNVLWLKADAGVSTSGSNVTSWNDASTNGMNGVAFNNPTLATANHNFNPTITFNGTNSYVDVADGFANFTAGATGFVAARPTANNTWSRFFDFGNGTLNNNINFRRVGTTSDLGYETVNGATGGSISSPATITNDTVNTYGFSQLGTTANLYKNGLSLTSGTVQSLQNITRTLNYIARSNWGADAYYAGDMSEIILYNRDLTSTERQKINTYLALKYGTTLDQSTAQNYIASDGTVLWNATTNATYKNNIAGILRDDASGLAQKQSQSVNAGLQVVIGNGNTIAASNAANTSTFLGDKSALIWGDNGASVTAWTTTGAPANRQILPRVWKVSDVGLMPANKIQIADNSGTNGLPAEATLIYLLVDNDGDFTSGATSIPMTLNGTNWEGTADFLDGNYFTFATQIPAAPGGVYNNLAIWYEAEDYNTSTGAWPDQSVLGNSAITNTNGTEIFSGCTQNITGTIVKQTANINFNTGLVTTTLLRKIQTPTLSGLRDVYIVNKPDVSQPTLFGLFGRRTTTGEVGIRGFSTTNWINTSNGNANDFLNTSGSNIYVNSISGDAHNNTWHILSEQRGTSPSATDEYLIGGYMDDDCIGSGQTNRYFNGNIAEVIAFNTTNNSATDRLKIETYLALKYGITLGTTSSLVNYTASDGSTIYWTGNATYQNNIAGIARDDNSTLYQKQSQSVNSGLQIVIGNGNTIAATNTANSSTFSVDKSALVWGDNAGSVASWTSTGAPTDRQIVARTWRVQETGTVGSVKIQIADNSGTNGLPTEGSTVTILVDADGNFTSGATEYLMTLNGTNWEANVDLTNGQFFTFSTPTALATTFTQTNVTCNGASTGAIDISVTGGIAPYTYDWGGGVTTQDRTGIPAGSYTVTVTDLLGSTTTRAVTITQLGAMNATVSKTDIACYGNNNGSIGLSTITGGSFSYEYRLDAGAWQSGFNFSSLSPSTYSVQMRDANHPTCVVVLGNQTITEPAAPLAGVITSQTNVLCRGASTGAVNITTSGGTAPYSYNWGGGITTEDRSSLPAGFYVLTISDFNGCTTGVPVTITQPALSLSATITSQTNILCFGASTGAINLTASGGTAPYTYNWGGGITTEDRSSIPAGAYNVTVTDDNLCTATTSATITEPAASLYATANANNVNCNGGTNGSINLTITGGTSPYSYDWGGGITTEDRSSLSAGAYSVTITDANLCTTTASATITQPTVLSAATITTMATCFSDGSIDLTPTGGTEPFNYDWADVSGTNNPQDRSALTPGTYNVTVTDANGCTATASQVIGTPVCNPAAITICQSTTNDVFSVDPDPMVDSYTWTVPAGAIIVSGQGTPSIIVNWTGASAGAGQVCVKTVNVCSESANVCFDVNIRVVPATASILVAPVCTNVNLELKASGGVSYSWSGPNGFTSTNELPVIYNPTAVLDGTYSVTVTDTEGCTDVASVNVSVKTAPSAITAITLAGCLTSTGAADLTVSSGLAPYSYSWSNGAVTEDISGILAGVYTVTVTDANGCEITKIAAVGNTPSPVVTPTITNVACADGATGAISLAVSGPETPFSYNWSNGATTQNISSLSKGIYNITVTDNLGCKTVVSNEITEPNSLQLDKTQTNINCFGSTTGTIDITATGGTGAYTYDWADIVGTNDVEDRSGLAAGTYSVTVTDANGCSVSTSVTITQPAAALSASTTTTNLACNGIATGVVNLTVTGGSAPYTYAWAGGATTEDRSSLLAGTYDVTITDANGCTTTASATLTQPTALSLSTSKVDVSCNGGVNGSINLTVSGGTTAYSYLWSDGSISEDITAKSAGTYSVTVGDANGCVATTSVTITEPTVLASSHTVSNVSCFNGTNGSVNLTITGGTAPYTYVWTGGETTEDISSKVAGTYYVTVTDALNCTLVTSATITEPTAVSISGIVTNVNCNGGSNGAINITATGGTGVLTYNWGSGVTTEDRTTLPIGTYTVTVTDANSCSTAQSFTITEPTILSLSTTTTNITCNGAANGSVNLTVSGGVTPYTYLWSNGATTEDLNTLNIGSYTVTITDANGCTASTSASITQPAALSTTPSVSNVNCFGGSTGSVSTATVGGTLPYSYAWSNGATTANISSITAGTYTLTLTDANGCSTVTPNTVTEPAAALSITGSYVDVSCFGGNNGSISTVTTGGTTAYTYAWSNGASTANLNTLVAGTYTITVTDNNLCTSSSTFVVAEPAAALSVSSVKTDVNCIGNANGAINLTVNGGTTPYVFNWSNGATTQYISNLIAGTYDVTVTDAKNCTTTTSVTITQPTAISLTSSVTHVVCLSGTNGAVNLTAFGGVAPYTYLWSNGATTEDISSISAGNYSVTLTDNNGCIAYLTSLVNDGTNPTAVIASTENSCTTDDDKILNGGSAVLTASGGTTYAWSTTETTAGITVNPIATTTYTVTVTDINGCTDTETKTITVLTAPTATITATENSCAPNDDKVLSGGSVSLVVGGGTSYNWNNGLGTDATQNINPSATTTYTVTVTDVNGCTDVISKTITIISAPNIAIAANETSCTTDDDKILNGASAILTATGAATYTWSTTETTAGITVNPSSTTTYTVTATDANGCVDISNKTIEVVSAPTASIAVDETSCMANDDKILSGASATLIASGGLSYLWSTTETTAGITVNPTATTTYTVTATDANGCTDIATKTITIVNIPSVTIAATENSCTTDDNKIISGASANLAASGSGVSYVWSTTETTASVTVNPTATTTYTVTTTDANGCTNTAIKTIEIILDAYISIDITENSCTLNDDKIFSGAATTFTAAGGVTYTWNTAETTTAITHNPAATTTYSVTATDVNGCIGSANKTVTVVSAPIAAIVEADTSCTFNDDKVLSAESATLTASGGVSYEWSTNEFSADITVFPTATTTYTVTVTDANGCTDIASKTITVVSPPTVSIVSTENSCTTNDDKILNGGSAVLTASGGVSYAWDNSLPAGAVQTVTPSVSTTYNVTVTDINGCTDTMSRIITIVPQPTAAISGNLSIIRGDNTTLTASGGNTYIWTTTETTAPITVTPTVTTSYTVTITDTNGCTDTETVTVLVDDYSIANRDDLTIAEDAGLVSINVITNDVFGNDGPSANNITITQMPTNGIANVDDNGTPNNPTDDKINYTPNLSFNGNDTLIYRICDIDGDCDTALVMIRVTAVNDAPIAVNDAVSTNEDTPVSNTVAANDSDTEGDVLTFSTITTVPAAQGILVFNNNGTYTFTPTANFNGVVTVDYQVCDAALCDTATLTITVNAVNDAPVAVNDAISTNEDTPVSSTVATNDSDTEGDVLTFSTITTVPAAQGTLVFNNDGSYTFTPTANFNGTVTVDYQVCDAALCDTATLTITVNAVNDAPVAVNDAVSTNEDTAVSSTVATNDSDIENDVLTFSTITTVPAAQGVLVFNNNGTYTFTPNANFNGTVTVDYQVCDAALCDTATLTITVNAVNDAPVAVNDAVSTNEDTPVSNTVATNDSDIENDVLTFTPITTVPAAQGVLVFNNDGTYTFTPATNFNGVVSVDYQVCDATLCDTATLTITVNAVNDAPVAVNDAISTNEDTPVSNTVATNDSDTEGDVLTFSTITTVPAAQGVLVFNNDGSYTFTPTANFNGIVTVDYQVCDAALCDTATLTITVNAVNDAPVAVNDAVSTNEDTPVSNTVVTNDSDIENDVLTFSTITTVPAAQGILVFNNDGTYTFTPNANFNGVVTVDYQVCDATLCDTATLTITVNAINDAPVAVNDAISTNEDTPVSNTVATNDSDIENDVLTFTPISTVPAAQGVLVFNNNGSYTFTPTANFNGTVTVDYQVCDAALCDTATLTINVNAVNDAPVAVNDAISTNEDTPVSNTVATNDSDIENDVLTFTPISTVPAAQGVLVFNNDGSYTFTPTANFNGTVSVDYQVCDAALCDTATLTITVNAINDAPVAVNDAISTNEDTAVSNTVATNDSDIENDVLTFSTITTVPAAQGILVFNNDGTYTFTPTANFNGVVTVDYQVCDPASLCDTATLTITVNAVNDTPVAVNDAISTNEDTPVSSTVATNDSDTEGDVLTFSTITTVPAAQGVLVFNNNGSYTFTPTANFNGTVTVDYQVCDAALCDTATLTITVNAVNDAPVAVNDAVSTNEDTPVSNTVATNDSDIENDVLTFSTITTIPAAQGTLVFNNDGTYTFTPTANFNGVVTVDYQVCDPASLCDTATLTININAINDAPVAVNDAISTNEDIAVSSTVATNDSDTEGDVLTFTQITTVPTAQGTLVFNNDGTYTFTPTANFNGVVSVDYQVCDAALCDTATLTINVNAVNDAPVAVNDAISTNEDTPVSNTVAINDSDIENDVLTFSTITTVPAAQGILVFNNDGTYTFTPTANFNGVVTVDYQVCDPASLCDTATLTITVNAVNDAPVAVNDAISTNEDTPVSSTVATNDSDTEGDVLTFSTITTVPAAQGVLVFNNNGSYTFTPTANFNGTVTVDYQVCDAALCDTATLTITVNAVNDAPVAVNDAVSTNEDTPVSNTVATNDSDIENDVLTFSTITTVPAAQGTLVFNNDGSYTFTPTANFNGVVTVDYQVCDAALCDTATLTITVNPVNDAPVAVNDAVSTNEDTPVSNTVAANDSDTEGNVLTFSTITTVPAAQGTLVFNNDGSYTFTPTANFTGTVTVDYQVCDAALCDTATLTITVNPVNDAPVAVNDVVSTNEDTPVSNTVATNDSDIENDVLTFTQITSVTAAQGVILFNPDGTYTFTPAINFNGVVNIDYQVCDPSGACDTATLTITVNPVNDAPVAVIDYVSTLEDTPVSGSVATNDSDLDGDILTFTQITTVPVTQGILVFNADGTFTFNPTLHFNGIVSITYQVCDPSGACDTAVLNINVGGVNNAPIAVDDAISTNEDTVVSNTVAPNDSDVDNIATDLSYTAITLVPVNQGVLVMNPDGSYTFTPALNFNGVVNIDYRVCDPLGLCDTATLTITVNPINDAPVAVNDTKVTNEDTPVTGTVATNDSDIENDVLVFTPITSVPVGQGVLVMNPNGSYTFTPALDFNGVLTIDYQVCDATLCDTATLTITVNPINDAPVATNATNTTNEDTPVTGTLTSNVTDVDSPAGSLTFNALDTVPAGQGSLIILPNGTYTFTPMPNFNGVVTVRYQVCDANGLCDTATLTITVNKINDAPIAGNDAISTNEDTPVSGSVATNDSDNENDVLTYTSITNVPAGQGVLVMNPDGSYTFTPAPNFNGIVTINYQVCDPSGACDTATLTINVAPINDAPVAIDDTNTTNEDTPVSGSVATNDSDTERSVLTYKAITTVPANEGVIVINPNGTYTFTPNPNFNGTTVVTYTVCDPNGACDTATLTIIVKATNDAPVAVNDAKTTNEDTPISGTVAKNDIDNDNDPLTFVPITNVPAGQGVLVMNPDGSYTFTPAPNFNGIVTINYQVCDPSGACDTAVLTINVAPVNDAPVAIDDTNTTNEDTPVNGSVATNDSDTEGGTLTYGTITNVPVNQGVIVLNPNGTYTFTPNPNFNGTVIVTYSVCDANGACDTATLTIIVNSVNDAPVAINDAKTTNEDTPVSGTVASNDSDKENDPLTFVPITNVPAGQGVLVMNPDGSYTFTPAPNFNGIVTINYQVCDPSAACDTAILTINVAPVNDTPVAIDDTNTTNEDTPVSGSVATNDSDTEGGTLTYSTITNVPVNQGVIILNPNGTYTFTPNPNFNVTVVVTYSVCDANGACDTATLTITVVPVNDAPIAVNDNVETDEDTLVPVSGTVANNDSDPENDPITFTPITEVPENVGIFTMEPDGTYTFIPVEDFNGTVEIDYVVCDSFGKCDTATLTIKVKPVNDPPIATDASNNTRNDKPVSGTLINNVIDVDKGPGLTFGQVGTTPPSQGTTVINPDGTYTFTPNPSYEGDVTIVYVVCDKEGACDTAVLVITVTSTNQPPVAVNDFGKTYKNYPVTGIVTTNDSDPDGDILVVNSVPVTNPKRGTVVIIPNGTYIYRPNSGFVGIDTFSYQVCDDRKPAKCDTAQVVIVVGELSFSSTIDTTLAEQVTDTICLNTDELLGKKYTVTNICPSNGQHAVFIVIPGTTCIKTTTILKGTEKGCFVVCDEFGFCDTTYIIINVTGTNRIKAVDDEAKTKQNQPVTTAVILNDSLYSDTLRSISIVLQGNHGMVSIDSSRNITYNPDLGFCGTDSILYQICSVSGCDIAVLRIQVDCNDIKVYDGFSPNGDGSNDVLIIEGLDQYPRHNLEVYNRWGNKVFGSRNYKNDWGGTWKDKLLPDGTYFYIIDNGQGKFYTGYIQLQK